MGQERNVTEEDLKRHAQSHADASICCKCGCPIRAESEIWLLRCTILVDYQPHWGNVYVSEEVYAAGCRECGRAAQINSCREICGEDPPMNRSGHCPGCGRTVHLVCAKHEAVYHFHRRTFFCSDRCRNRVHGATFRRRHRRPSWRILCYTKCAAASLPPGGPTPGRARPPAGRRHDGNGCHT